MKRIYLLVILILFSISCVKKPIEDKVIKKSSISNIEKVQKNNSNELKLSNRSDNTRKFSIEERGSSKKSTTMPSRNLSHNKVNNRQSKGNFPILNLEDASLWEVIKIVSDFKKWNYLIDPKVPDKGINIRMNKQVNNKNIDNILNILLSIYDVSKVERDGVVYFTPVKGSSDLKSSAPILFGNGLSRQLSGEGWVTQIIPLNFASAKDISGIIKDFMSPSASYYPDDVTSTIVVIDRAPYIKRILEMVKLLDVNVFKNKKMALIKFENADAEKVADSLQKIFKGYPGLDPTKYYIVSLKEMNALLCITSNKEILEEVKFWAKKYEKESEVGETQVFVYNVEHSSAEDLSKIITDLYANDYQSSRGKDGKTIQKPVIQGDLKIITDQTNNALIFKCTKRDYNIIEKTMKKLDQPKKQVLIEMKILDLSLTDNFQYGFKWYLKQKAEGRSRGQAFNFLSGALEGSYNFLFDSRTLEGIFNADETKSKTNVISQPNVLVLDNEQASINIGDQISIQTGNISVPQTSTSGFYNSQSYQYLSTGIQLSVKPSISSNGVVRLEIKQSHTIPGDAPAEGGNPPIATRDIQTIVNVPDGKSVLLGGMISETNTHADNSTPLLSKIPIVRYFFGGQNKTYVKKELIMIITPRIVYSPEEATSITSEFEQRINDFKYKLYGEKVK